MSFFHYPLLSLPTPYKHLIEVFEEQFPCFLHIFRLPENRDSHERYTCNQHLGYNDWGCSCYLLLLNWERLAIRRVFFYQVLG